MALMELCKVSQADRHKFCSYIIESSAPKADFYFLVVLSTIIVALGILADNVILVIGGMLVTPILSPILAIALGIVINEHKVITRSVKIFLTAFAFAFVVAFLLGLFSSANLHEINIIRIMEPSLFTFFVAVVAGIAASYTWAKPGLNETLPGIAITVTLIPPLTAVGLTVADGEWLMFAIIFKALLLNAFGIIVASLVILSLMDFYKAKEKVVAKVKQEEKQIKKEKEKKEQKKADEEEKKYDKF
jgi:uncharacterized hydrophobic protein (TIGR00271 family)